MIKRYSYQIRGQVQGVGFRPFVYKLATSLDLIGFIQNDNAGVFIEIEGEDNKLKEFEDKLKCDLPLLAKINKKTRKKIEPLYKGQFEIIDTDHLDISTSKIASVPPDIAICNECKLDINKTIKYKNYFATNCTNCGPRYSIIQTVP